MTVLERLKMELSNQEYFEDEQYIQFLSENGMTPTDDYDKATMQKSLLMTVLDVLDAVTNDVDIMSNISTEFSNIGQAFSYMELRKQNLRDKIAAIPVIEDDEFSPFTLMFTRTVAPARPTSMRPIGRTTIDQIVREEFGDD